MVDQSSKFDFLNQCKWPIDPPDLPVAETLGSPVYIFKKFAQLKCDDLLFITTFAIKLRHHSNRLLYFVFVFFIYSTSSNYIRSLA